MSKIGCKNEQDIRVSKRPEEKKGMIRIILINEIIEMSSLKNVNYSCSDHISAIDDGSLC